MHKKHVIKIRVRKIICLRRAGPAQKTMLIRYRKKTLDTIAFQYMGSSMIWDAQHMMFILILSVLVEL